MTLSMVHQGTAAVVRRVSSGRMLTARLAAMGIAEGSLLTVVSNKGHGPILVDLDGTRVAMGRGMAEKVVVEARS